MYSKRVHPLTPLEGKRCNAKKKRKNLGKKNFQEFFNSETDFKEVSNGALSGERSSWETVDGTESSESTTELEDDVFFSKKSSDLDSDDNLSAPEIMKTSEDGKDETSSLDHISWSDDSSGSQTEDPALHHKEILHSTAINFNEQLHTHPISPYFEKLLNFSSMYHRASEIEDLLTMNFDAIYEAKKDLNSSNSSRLSHENSKQNPMKNILHSTKINSVDGSPTRSLSRGMEELSFSPINPNKNSNREELSSINPDKIGISMARENQDEFEMMESPGKKTEDMSNKRLKRISTTKLRKKSTKKQAKSRAEKQDPKCHLFCPNLEKPNNFPIYYDQNEINEDVSTGSFDEIFEKRKDQNSSSKSSLFHKSSTHNKKKNILHSTKINSTKESLTLQFSPCIPELSFPPRNRNTKINYKELSAIYPDTIGKSMEHKNRNDFKMMETPRKGIEDLTNKRFKRMSTSKSKKKPSKKQTKSRAAKKNAEYEEILRYEEYLKTLPIDDLSLSKYFKNKK